MSEEEKTERGARAIYESDKAPHDPDWDRLDGGIQDAYRRAMRAVLTALKEEGQSYGDIVQLKSHLTALAAFAKEVILAIWDAHRNNADLDGSDVLEEAERHGVIVLRPDDAEGNDAFELAPWLSRIQKEEGQATRADDGATAPATSAGALRLTWNADKNAWVVVPPTETEKNDG